MAKERTVASDKELAEYYAAMNAHAPLPDGTYFQGGVLYKASDEDLAIHRGEKLPEAQDGFYTPTPVHVDSPAPTAKTTTTK